MRTIIAQASKNTEYNFNQDFDTHFLNQVNEMKSLDL